MVSQSETVMRLCVSIPSDACSNLFVEDIGGSHFGFTAVLVMVIVRGPLLPLPLLMVLLVPLVPDVGGFFFSVVSARTGCCLTVVVGFPAVVGGSLL